MSSASRSGLRLRLEGLLRMRTNCYFPACDLNSAIAVRFSDPYFRLGVTECHVIKLCTKFDRGEDLLMID